MTRRPDWHNGERGWNVGLSDVSTARHIVDRDYVRDGRRWLIHAGGRFFEWSGEGWTPADVDVLERKIWELLRCGQSQGRVRKVLYALKIDTLWPPAVSS